MKNKHIEKINQLERTINNQKNELENYIKNLVFVSHFNVAELYSNKLKDEVNNAVVATSLSYGEYIRNLQTKYPTEKMSSFLKHPELFPANIINEVAHYLERILDEDAITRKNANEEDEKSQTSETK